MPDLPAKEVIHLLEERINAAGNGLAVATERRREIVRDIKSTRQIIAARNSEAEDLKQAVGMLQALLDSQRQIVRRRVEDIVQLALRSVFGSRMSFQIEQDIRYKQVAMTPKVGYCRKKITEWMAMDQVGGGVRDVVSFAMRVTILAMMKSRGVAQIIIADEPFKHVSNSYLPAVAMMISDLSKSIGMQLIIVSHEEDLARNADRVIRVLFNGKESVEESAI